MKVAVLADRMDDLDSAAVGAALARGFAAHAQVAVVPLAAGGLGLAQAVAQLAGGQVVTDGVRWRVSTAQLLLIGIDQPGPRGWLPSLDSAEFGQWVAECLADSDATPVVLDLTGLRAHDGGAGLLAAAGERLSTRELIGVVDAAELSLPASGIGGGLARRAFAATVDVATLLSADAALSAYADGLRPGLATVPGSGAAGTCALAVLGAGGRLTSGTQLCADLAGVARTLPAADLVVTACGELSALDRGGPVVAVVAEWAEQQQKPCILFSTGTGLSRRELRTLGMESLHLVEQPPTSEQLTTAAARIAAGWLPGPGSADVDSTRSEPRKEISEI